MANKSIKTTYDFPDASTFIEAWNLGDKFENEFEYELNNTAWKMEIHEIEVIEKLLHHVDGEYIVKYNEHAEKFEVIELEEKTIRIESEGNFIPPIEDSPGREINDDFIIKNFLGKTLRIYNADRLFRIDGDSPADYVINNKEGNEIFVVGNNGKKRITSFTQTRYDKEDNSELTIELSKKEYKKLTEALDKHIKEAWENEKNQ